MDASPARPAGDDAALARRLAEQAGDLLLRLRRELTAGEDLRAAGDSAAQAFLSDQLSQLRPYDAMLSEEAVDDAARLHADRVWIVDPLDGTREYAEGRQDWAVHVALWERGELAAGAVALPGRSTTLATDAPPAVPPRRPGPWRATVSRSRADAGVLAALASIRADVVPWGSAGFKAATVLLGEMDAYVHAGGQYEWDSAAPVAVALAAGLHCSRLDGSPLIYNAANPYLPDLVVCRPELAVELLVALDSATSIEALR
jgi:3'(2'), 5'-bisphosphate nucleotidase